MTDDPAMAGMEPSLNHRAVAANPQAAVRATLALLVSRVVVAALGWAGSVIVARSLPAEQWGQFSFVFGVLALMAIFTDLGVGRVVLARLIDGDPEEIARTASSFLALRTVLGLVGFAIAVGYVIVLRYPGPVITATAVAGLVVVLATPNHALALMFQSRHRLLLVAVSDSLGQGVQLALTVLAAIFAPTLLIFILPAVANETLKLLIKAFGVRRKTLGLRPSRHIEVRRWGEMLRESIPLAIGFALTLAMAKIDILLLSLLDTYEAIGVYSIGYKFSDFMDTISLAAAGPVSTLLVAAWPNQLDVFRQRTRSAATLFMLGAAVCVAGFWPSAEKLINMLYGERFVPGAQAARLLVLGSALLSLIILGIWLLTAAGKQRKYPLVAVFGLALNLGLNLVLIPRLSYNGSAIATVATFGTTVVILWIVIARTMPIARLLPVRRILGIGGVTAAVTVAGTYIVDRWPSTWPLVSVAAVMAVVVFTRLLRLTGQITLPLPARKAR